MGIKKKLTLAASMCALFVAITADACTRAVYQGPDDMIITARSMDWRDEIHPNLWLFPKGMERDGAAGPNPLLGHPSMEVSLPARLISQALMA